MKFVPPSIQETAFSCPNCGALAQQFWYSLYASRNDEKHPLPIVLDKDGAQRLKENVEKSDDNEGSKTLIDWAGKMATGVPFLHSNSNGAYANQEVNNVSISDCFNCKRIAIWVFDRLLYPARGEAPPPNPDMPEDIRRDYDEASTVLDLSPRGAAALIRLAIQKLCIHLGQPGKRLHVDIGALVADGLNVHVQKALDAVRVIGNEAVHPGQIDLRDDRATAETLFRLLNLITEKMISEPKHIDEVYRSLPEQKRKDIERRDGKPERAT